MGKKLHNIWALFLEFVWSATVGKVATLLGIIGTVQTAITLVKPEWVITIANRITLDTKFWYVTTIIMLLVIIIIVLIGASKYKARLEAKHSIRLVYNERYPPCRELSQTNDIETIRVGIRSIGIEPVDNLIVLPSTLEQITRRLPSKRMPITSSPLMPMTGKVGKIMRGYTPAYYIDVFKHKLGTDRIELCYDSYSEAPIILTEGNYELTLIARGTPNENHVRTMTISVDKNYKIKVELDKYDFLG